MGFGTNGGVAGISFVPRTVPRTVLCLRLVQRIGVFKETEDCMYCSESGRASSLSSGKNVRKISGSKAQLHCRGFSENTEVFRKEPLETKGGISMDEKRGKQKRRDRVSKTKTHSSKSKVSIRGLFV